MKQRIEGRSKRGMTLVELMIAMLLFTVLALGMTATVLQSQRMSYQAIYENAAFNAAQGFLEQMRSMPYSEFLAVYNSPNTVSLATLSTTTSGSDLVVDDPLNYYVDNQGVYNPQGFDSKTIVIDARSVEGEEVDITMDMRFRLKLRDLAVDVDQGQTPWTAFEVKLAYEYEVPTSGGTSWKNGSMVTVIAKHEI